MNTEQKTEKLLARLAERNQLDEDHGPQEIHCAKSGLDKITTLDGSLRSLSPMIRARFEFADRWSNANLEQDWLGIEEISRVSENPTATRWMNLRRENWDHCPPGSVLAENCAIFGLNPYEPEETYLVWDKGEVEPQIWRYAGADYKVFRTFDRFLEYILGDRSSDDAGR